MNNNQIEEALATQAKQIADLQTDVAALKGAPSVEPKPKTNIFREPEASVITTIHRQKLFEMPNESSLRELLALVHKKRPARVPKFSGRFADQDERDYFKGFVAAFEAIGNFGRAPKPDTKRHTSYWVDRAEDWFRDQGLSVTGDLGAAYFAALLAHGDIDYIEGNNSGVVGSYALVTYGGRPSNNFWKTVLASGQLREPLNGGVRPLYPTPEVNISNRA